MSDTQTNDDKIAAMKAWANAQIGKLPGPITYRTGETIINPDKFIHAQLLLMEYNEPKSMMFTLAYMRLFTLKKYINK